MSALDRADQALAKSDWPAALAELLDAWRVSRAVRLAEVIDRVSERIAAERGPIEGKTVTARSAAWLAIAKEQDPADLARLLVTPWPGKWQDWVPLVDALNAYPADPRFALPFARLVEATPFDSWKSMGLYHSFLRLVTTAGDVRALPILEADLAKEKHRYWNQRVKHAVVAAVTNLRAATPAVFSADDEARLAAIEARFATATQTKKSATKNEAEFLAAIRANPDDDAARAVYADFLIEQGDPRGELISLQLNPSPNAAAQKRIAALCRKHEKAWSGALDKLTAKGSRRFTRGFLSGGHLRNLSYKAAERAQQLAHPEWALFETLRLGYQGDEATREIFARPWAKNLRELWDFSAGAAKELATLGPDARLEALHMRLMGDFADAGAQLAAPGVVPKLKRLGVDAYPAQLEPFLAGLTRRLDSLSLHNSDWPLTATIALVVKSKLDVEVVSVWCDYFGEHPWWTCELRKGERGRYTKLRVCSPEVAPPTDRGEDPVAALVASLAVHEPTEIVIEPRWTFTASEREAIEAAAKAIPSLKAFELPA